MPYKARLKPGERRKRRKPGYGVTNARAYNQSLRKRGMISVYVPDGDLKGLCPDGCEFPCCRRDYPFLTQTHLPNEFHRFTRLAMTTPSPSCDASFCVSRRSPMQRLMREICASTSER